jgi:hypothetical protein
MFHCIIIALVCCGVELYMFRTDLLSIIRSLNAVFTTTKEYFPDIERRLKMKLKFTGNQTTILTGHGNIKAYLHRFYIRGDQKCPCGEGDQTTDHIIYDCSRLEEERDRMRAAVNKTEDWPTSKRNLLQRHYKEFSKFINTISFEELNAEGN